MAIFAVTHKAGFKAGLYTGDNTLVNVALALLAARHFDVEVDKPLAIDDCHAQLLCVRSIKQHAFHTNFSFAH